MKEVSLKIYTVDELDENVRNAVIEEYRDILTEHDWWEPIYEGFHEDMLELGLEGELYFSGFWSQGDGACFVSDTVDTDLLVRKLYESGYDIPEDALLYSGDYSIRISKVHASFANQYSHEYTIEAVITNESDRIPTTDITKLENVLTEWIRSECKLVYMNLEKYYEELVTDEAVLETIRENEWMFTESGLNAQKIVNNF
jgi:hypothetical protein